MDPASILLEVLAALGLITAHAALIAAQNSILGVRRARVEQLARAGERRARKVADALERPGVYRIGARAATTAVTVALAVVAYRAVHGWLGPLAGIVAPETAVAGLPDPASWTAHGLAIVAAVAFVTSVATLVAQRSQRLIPEARAEQLLLWSTGPIMAVGARLRPFIEATDGMARFALRTFGRRRTAQDAAPTGDPPRTEPVASEELAADEEELISGVLDFGTRIARDVMTPRPDMVAVPVTATREEVLEVVLRERHSRIPVYQDNLDNVIGVLLVKDLLVHLVEGDPADFDLRRLMREPYFVPDTKPVGVLLAEFRARNVHMAIVLDEFGGTEGLVTLEDLIEEIVGEIYDEFDLPEQEYTVTPEGDVLIDGRAGIAEFNERFGLHLPEGDFNTLGGYVFGELGRIPEPGDVVTLDERHELRVEETQDRRVTRLRLTVRPAEADSVTA